MASLTDAPPGSALTDRALLAQARCRLWERAAACFRYPCESEFAELCSSSAWSSAQRAASAYGDEHLTRATVDACQWLTDAAREDVERAHVDAFGHSVRCPAPPYETEWGISESLLQPNWIADAAAFYKAHGLALAPEGERADHVSVECEFLSFLAFKEVNALRSGALDLADECAGTYVKFLQEHLGRFALAFAEKLAGEGGGPLPRFAELLQAIVRAEYARLGLTPGDESIGQRILNEDDENACMTCPLHAPAEAPR
jgi:TorA maturation chaperone TorD